MEVHGRDLSSGELPGTIRKAESRPGLHFDWVEGFIGALSHLATMLHYNSDLPLICNWVAD
jgi:hypothetical protein